MLHLLKIEDHVKNFRPQILLLSGLPCTRPALVYVANSITRGAGLLVCGHVSGKSVKERGIMSQESYRWLRRRKIRAFYDFVATKSTAEGIRALIQTSGLGKMRPNIIMMGFLNSWRTCNESTVEEYVGAIHEAFDANLGVIILCIKEGFDISNAINFEKLVLENADESRTMESTVDISAVHAAAPLEVRNDITDPILLERIAAAQRFLPAKKKHMAGHISIWWLYDDGGLTILIPYLMAQRGIWSHCPIKLYCLAGKDPVAAQNEMLSLLAKFRITVQEVIPIDLDTPPSPLSVTWFHDMIGVLRDREPMPKRKMSGLPVIKDSDLFDFGHRTLRQIRLRELLLEHSKADSCLNVVTMPLPKTSQSSTFFLSVLHSLTDSLPPTLLIRGSQENVLTYYC
ncbi:hypothetical protein RvY_16354 [Ramazzottius varieornatus]|uniref:SLC12A transporter C-terminal domain-containing protein n=1 Tax=Ramazzottius varieornatus TaxID=947166 RepID=A0A1D1VY57_RAMVA|nr:hypothetical protein RvY_16354 [Ramazzottius varieornatus]